MKYTLLSCMLIITHVCVSMDKDHNEDGVRRRSRTMSNTPQRRLSANEVAMARLLHNNADKRRSMPANTQALNQYGSVFFETEEVTTGGKLRQSTSEPALPTDPTNTNQ